MKNELMNDDLADNAIWEGSEFSILVERGILSQAELEDAASTAQARGIELEKVLLREFSVAKQHLLDALAAYYRCDSISTRIHLPRTNGCR
jgi:hypothetical protein